MAQPAEITMAMVQIHNKPSDLWIVIENKVYDLSKFRREHPGGEEPLDEVAGKEATKEFIEVGHSSEAREMMKKYYVGDVAASDRKKELPLSSSADAADMETTTKESCTLA